MKQFEDYKEERNTANKSVYDFVDNNYELLIDLENIAALLNERLEAIKKVPDYMGDLDRQKIAQSILKYENELNRLTDLLIGLLETRNGVPVVPKNEEIIAALDEVESDNDEDSQDDSEMVNEMEGEDDIENRESGSKPVDFERIIKERIERHKKEHELEMIEMEKMSAAGLNNDKERIEEILNLIKAKPEDSIEGAFDPQGELIKIRKTKRGIDESGDSYRERKKNALAQYRVRLVEQQINMYSMSEQLLEKLQDRKIDFANIESDLENNMERYNLSGWQRARFMAVLDEIKKRIDLTAEFWEKNKKKPKDSLIELSGHSVNGRVTMEKLPIAIIYQCHDFMDYVRVACMHDGEISEDDIEEAETGRGKHINAKLSDGVDIIIINRSKIKGKGELRDVIDHEYIHAITECIDEAIDIDISISPELDILRGDMKLEYERALQGGKKEILAFLKGGVDHPMEIYDMLIGEGGGYEFFRTKEELREEYGDDYRLSEYPWNDVKQMQDKYAQKYAETVMDAIVAASVLLDIGMSDEYIISLFATEDLSKWNKIVNRLLDKKASKSGDMSEEDVTYMNTIIQNQIKAIEKTKKILSGANKKIDLSDPLVLWHYEKELIYQMKVLDKYRRASAAQIG
jgi:hypothetical protein